MGAVTMRAVVAALALVVTAGTVGTVGAAGTVPPLAVATTMQPAAATAARCPGLGSLGPSSGAARVVRRPAVALLRNVQVQASGCVDEVAFLFRGGVPGWSVHYQRSALVGDPSGRPVALAGAAHLVVRLSPASGVDLAGARPAPVYDGPTLLHPARPSAVVALRQLGDFEAVTTWAIGLPDRRRFEVVRRSDQLVVRIAVPSRRVTRCALTGTRLTVGYPVSWFTELGDRWPCRFFDPHPFVILPATDAFSWAVTVSRAATSASAVAASARSAGTVVRQFSARVAGFPATVLDLKTSGYALYPAGWRYRLYVVNTGTRAVTIASTAAAAGSRATANATAAAQIAALLRRG